MRKIRVSPRTAYIQHPADEDIRVLFRVPTRPQALAVQAEMSRFEKVRAVIDPTNGGGVLLDPKTGRPVTERYLEMPSTKLSEILGRFIEKVEGLTVDKDGEEVDAWGNGFTPEDLMDPALDYEEMVPVLDENEQQVYEKAEDGGFRLDDENKKIPVKRLQKKTYWGLVLEHYTNPDRVRDEAAGKGGLTPSNA